MQCIAVTRRRIERFSEAEIAAHLDAEAARAKALYAQGVFRSINSRGDKPGAVIVLEAADLAAAQAVMESMPLAQLEMMDVEVIPLLPYRGFV
jgi:uncharacterized protein YciI